MSSSGYQYLDDTGVIVPDTADLQTEVGSEYKVALNDAAMPTDPETPQGALIVAETLARANVLGNNAAVANQINPNIAGGIFLESLCRLTGLEPPSATYTLITNVPVTGRINTVIPEGTLVAATLDAAAPKFAVVATTTILGPGTLVTLQAVDSGPVPAPLGVPWYVISAVLGFETVTTVGAAAVIGTDKLTDAELRTLRAQTLALQGVSIAEAITSALNDTPGVQSIAFRENVADTTQTIDGISMVAHSIWACVNGGTNTDVATALLGCKTLGANWNGATTVNVVDPSSGQTYPVKFDRPTSQNIWVRVTYIGATVTGDGPTLITNAILAYQAGSISGMPGFVVGADVSPFELAAAVASQVPGIFVTKVEVSTDGVTYQTTQIVIPLNQIAVVIAGRISTVAV